MRSDSLAQSRNLYQQHYGELIDFCLESSTEVLIPDAERIVANLWPHLDRFTGTDEQFVQWAHSTLEPALFFYKILAEHRAVIHAAIWDTLGHGVEPNRYDDDAELEKELFGDVCIEIMKKLPGLMRPGRAKLSTRIYALAQWQVRKYLKSQRTRFAAVNRRLAQGRGFVAETLSDGEIAEMKAIEQAQITA